MRASSYTLMDKLILQNIYSEGREMPSDIPGEGTFIDYSVPSNLITFEQSLKLINSSFKNFSIMHSLLSADTANQIELFNFTLNLVQSTLIDVASVDAISIDSLYS